MHLIIRNCHDLAYVTLEFFLTFSVPSSYSIMTGSRIAIYAKCRKVTARTCTLLESLNRTWSHTYRDQFYFELLVHNLLVLYGLDHTDERHGTPDGGVGAS